MEYVLIMYAVHFLSKTKEKSHMIPVAARPNSPGKQQSV